MKILDVTPMLTVVELEPAIEFYRDILGFKCSAFTDSWACMDCDGTELMLALPNSHLPFDKPAMTGSLYFNTDECRRIVGTTETSMRGRVSSRRLRIRNAGVRHPRQLRLSASVRQGDRVSIDQLTWNRR
jgi:catechol 2,3-dioxygenase-like lactoylglutathione lyase family enzyme